MNFSRTVFNQMSDLFAFKTFVSSAKFLNFFLTFVSASPSIRLSALSLQIIRIIIIVPIIIIIVAVVVVIIIVSVITKVLIVVRSIHIVLPRTI